jgi:two-component sensor histidine kinase
MLILGFLYYTQTLVNDLQEQSHAFLQFRVKIFEKGINSDEVENLSLFFNEIIQQADYPIIYSDYNGEPAYWRNIEIPQISERPIPGDIIQKLKKKMENFDKTNEPIPISYDGSVLGYYHYGESQIVQRLRWLPYIEILVVALFILIGYSGFSSIKKSEERFIWVGMAKETAHQLGTPLSSLMGWLDLLKSSPGKSAKILPDLERDLKRLKQVTNRFSKIGSLPDLKNEDIKSTIYNILFYFKRRLPKGKGKIELKSQINREITSILINKDLFSWVIENLIKNSIDALEGNSGTISVSSDYLNDKKIFIDIQDNGKGISSRNKRNIFKPGYSTKKRGWGLGLSLAKRIIEDYHGGTIYLKDSQVGIGSTFRIILNRNNK